MAISEETRHQLYVRLEEVLGPDQAATLMEHLPPVGWADVATKRDLDHLGSELRGELGVFRAEVRAEFAESRAGFQRDLRGTVMAMLAANTTLMGLLFAALKLA